MQLSREHRLFSLPAVPRIEPFQNILKEMYGHVVVAHKEKARKEAVWGPGCETPRGKKSEA